MFFLMRKFHRDDFSWVGALSSSYREDHSWQRVRRLCLLVGPVIGTMAMTLVKESHYIAEGVKFRLVCDYYTETKSLELPRPISNPAARD